MFSPFFKQLYGATSCICAHFSIGFYLALQTIFIPTLIEQRYLDLTVQKASWIPAAFAGMMIPSLASAGYLMDRYGRRPCLILANIPTIISAILLYNANEFWHFVLSYALAGMLGSALAAGPAFVVEMASPKHRGTLMNAKAAGLAFGTTVSHFLGMYIDWRTLALCSCIPSIIALITTATSPESPSWFALVGEFDKSKEAYAWYRGDNDKAELEKMIDSQRMRLTIQKEKRLKSSVKLLIFIKTRAFWKPVIMNIFITLYEQSNLKTIFTYFAINLTRRFIKDTAHANLYAAGLDLVDFSSGIVACIIIAKFNRKSIMLSTGILSSVVNASFCLLAYLLFVGVVSDEYSYVLFLLMVLFCACTSLGVMPVLMATQSEILPLVHKGFVSIVNGFVTFGISCVQMRLFPYLMENFALHVTFTANMITKLISFVVLWIIVPETNNKTMQDIEEKIQKVKKSKSGIMSNEHVPMIA